MKFIRVDNSEGGTSDLPVGTVAGVLAAQGNNGPRFTPALWFPVMFSYTQPWEADEVARIGGVDYGCANFTAEFERASGTGTRYGPGRYTSLSDSPIQFRV